MNEQLLPDQAKEIVTVIGLQDTMRLVSMYGGLTIRFSEEGQGEIGSRRDMIVQVLGRKKASAFFKHFANQAIYIPRCAQALKHLRDVQIAADYTRGTTVPELVQKYAPLSERSIWRIVVAMKSSPDVVAALQAAQPAAAAR